MGSTVRNDRKHFQRILAPLLAIVDVKEGVEEAKQGATEEEVDENWHRARDELERKWEIARAKEKEINEFYRNHVHFPNPHDKPNVCLYIEQRFQLANGLLDEGNFLEGMFHLANARAFFLRSCYYNPLDEYKLLDAKIPQNRSVLFHYYLLSSEEKQVLKRHDEQLREMNQYDDDENYDDDVHLRHASYPGDETDVSSAVAFRIEGMFPTYDLEVELDKLCTEQLELFNEAKRKGEHAEAISHLMNALICKFDRLPKKWPNELRLAAKVIEEYGYDRVRLYKIAEARRRYLDSYVGLLDQAAQRATMETL